MGFSAVAGGIADLVGGGAVADAIGTIGAGALYGAGASALTGGNAGKGALIGGLTGGLGGSFGSFSGPLNGALTGVESSLGAPLTGALMGGGMSALTGGNVMQGALMGGLGGAARDAFGNSGTGAPVTDGSPTAASGGMSPSSMASMGGTLPIDPGAPNFTGSSPNSVSSNYGLNATDMPSAASILGSSSPNGALSPLATQAMSAGIGMPSAALDATGGGGGAVSPSAWGVPVPAATLRASSSALGNPADIRGQFGQDTQPGVASYTNPSTTLNSFLGNGALSKILGGNANGGDYLRTLSSLMTIMNAGNAKKATRNALGSTSALYQPTQITYAGPGLSAPISTTFAKPRSISDATAGNLKV